MTRTSAVSVGSDEKISIVRTALTSQQTTALRQGWPKDLTLNVGIPVKVSTSGRLPSGGIRLSRTYQRPLPAGFSASMAFYDDKWGAWHAVPSALSSDRRTVTALVHHLSLWTDFTGALGNVKTGASKAVRSSPDSAYYQVGKVFDTRVDPPKCSSKPQWLDSSIFIDTNHNNPLLFCVGRDPKHPSVLVVKARVNRGFVYNAYLGSATSWTYNSTFAGESTDDAIAAVGHLDQDLSKTWDAFSPQGSLLVGAGQELSFGATEQQIRAMRGTSTVLKLDPPSAVAFMVSTIGQLAGARLQMSADGYAAGAIAVAGCYSDVKAAHDPGTWTRAALTCLGNLDERAAKSLASYLTKRGADPVVAGKTAGRLLGRISIYLALFGPVFSTMNYLGEQVKPESARIVNVYPTIEQKVSAKTLQSAQVPADCQMPAQRLKNNVTTKGSPGQGNLIETVRYGDLAGLGYKQALTAYVCGAGGVSWPEDLVLIGAGGKLLASLNLGTFVPAEHSDLDTVSINDRTAQITWNTYEGAGFGHVYQSATVTYRSGKFVLSNHTITYSPEAVTSAILGAQFEKKRASLKDPHVVTDAQWEKLHSAYSDFVFTTDGSPGTCITAGATATCPFEGVKTGPVDVAGSMTLKKTPGTGYGWRVTKLLLPG